MMENKIEIKKIDKENWMFVIYETPHNQWIGDFVYSPISFIDLSMLILLSADEKRKAEEDRNYLLKLSEQIRNDYNQYKSRALNRRDYILVE